MDLERPFSQTPIYAPFPASGLKTEIEKLGAPDARSPKPLDSLRSLLGARCSLLFAPTETWGMLNPCPRSNPDC